MTDRPSTPLLDTVDVPADLRKLKPEDLRQFADELRAEMISAVGTTGGHLGSGLGVVELTTALHYVFDTPRDQIVWDVGHQCYPHKIITGRRDRIRTLRTGGGLSGFTKRSESEYDPFGAAHSSTSISAALGFAIANKLKDQPGRLATATTLQHAEVARINGEELMRLLSADPGAGQAVMNSFATLINTQYTVPETRVRVREVVRAAPASASEKKLASGEMGSLQLNLYRISLWLKSPKPYLMLVGFAMFLGLWYYASEVWKLPRFKEMPGPTVVFKEWFNPDPVYGLSVYEPEYYKHIWHSVRRVAKAFFLATVLGVSLGLFLGWSKKFREYIFPVFETLRPIPILAWVPLAILMFTLTESSVIFLTFLASFFATALNTMLGVQSIDESYTRAAACLGANKWQVFRQIIIPGSLPFVFTGLQISVGVAWFSLVAAEMVSGQYGLGYVINTAYTDVKYPTIVIGMITLGAVGYSTSALVRILGDHLMQWRVRELALGAQ